MKILAVDSSSITASVAVIDDDKIVSEFFMNAGLTHSQTLAPMIDAVLKNSNTEPKEIDLYAVTNGPGSFTGLRIGAATIKAMAFANNKPCVAVSSLEALAYNSCSENSLICACMDARCDQVYTALFENGSGIISRVAEDSAELIPDLTEKLAKMDKNIEFVGDGALACYNKVIESDASEKYFLLPEHSRYIKAHNVARLALEKYKSDEFCMAEDLSLSYLRIPQAERQLNERLSKSER